MEGTPGRSLEKLKEEVKNLRIAFFLLVFLITQEGKELKVELVREFNDLSNSSLTSNDVSGVTKAVSELRRIFGEMVHSAEGLVPQETTPESLIKQEDFKLRKTLDEGKKPS